MSYKSFLEDFENLNDESPEELAQSLAPLTQQDIDFIQGGF